MATAELLEDELLEMLDLEEDKLLDLDELEELELDKLEFEALDLDELEFAEPELTLDEPGLALEELALDRLLDETEATLLPGSDQKLAELLAARLTELAAVEEPTKALLAIDEKAA